MTRIVQAPNLLATEVRIFLAGSIEMGSAENWQDKLIKKLDGIDDLLILNPRRDDWDSSWVQSIDDPQFYDQVTWELGSLDCADLIALYFDPTTKSPITLLELGLFAASGKIIVCCPPGFWRKGNVDIVCEKWEIPLYEDYLSFENRIYNEVS